MNDDVAAGLERARELGARENGLAVAITGRMDGSPRASVVNAGVLEHPVAGGRVVGFVSRGAARKLADLRARPEVTVVFRPEWSWVAVEGVAELSGPSDRIAGMAGDGVVPLLRTVYAAAVGGTPEQWAGLDESFLIERHTAVLVRPMRIYPRSAPGD